MNRSFARTTTKDTGRVMRSTSRLSALAIAASRRLLEREEALFRERLLAQNLIEFI